MTVLPPRSELRPEPLTAQRPVTAARMLQAVDMSVPLITISPLGLILNDLLELPPSYLLRGFAEA